MVLLAACLAIFMVSVEATIVATAIPTIVGDLGGLRLFSWVFGIYFLTQAVAIPIYGRLADIYGRKRLLVASVALFLIGSILSGFAHSMIGLIVYRGLQGLGGGGVQPLATTIVGDVYTGEARARVQGYLSSTWGISAVAGPLLGAFIIAHIGWPAIFWINVPFGILCIVLVLKYVDERVPRRAHRIDYLGAVLLAAGVGTLMFVLTLAGDLSRSATVTLSIVAAVLIALLIAHELRTAEPMMPLRLFRLRVIGVANAGNFAIGALSMGITAFLPTYVQGVMGLSAVAAGSTLGVMIVSWTISAIISSRFLASVSYRARALAGGVFLVCGSAFLIALTPASSIAVAMTGSALIGFGFGFVNFVFVVTTQAAVGWEQRGAVTASNVFMRQLGQALGTAVFAAVFNLGLDARIPDATAVVTRLIDPATRGRIAPDDVQRYAAAVGASLHAIYVILGVLGAAIFLLTLSLPATLAADIAEPVGHTPAKRAKA